MSTTSRVHMMALAAILGFIPTTASAQVSSLLLPPPSAPPAVAARATHRLDLGLNVSGGYDLVSTKDTTPGLLVDPRLTSDSAGSNVTGTLSFSRASRRMSFGASGGGNLQYYNVSPDALPVNYYGGMNISGLLSRRVQASASVGGSYSPYYSFGDYLVPRSDASVLTAPQSTFNVARLNTYTVNASGGLGWTAGRRTTVTTGYSFGLVDTSNSAFQTTSMGANVGMGHQMTRYASLRLGYSFSHLETGAQRTAFDVHNIDVGLGYSRPLSFSRRTLFSFNTGTSLIVYVGDRVFTFTGDASLSHQLTRRTLLSGAYHRGITVVPGVTRPVVSDVVSTSLGGGLTRYLSYSIGGSYAIGHPTLRIDNGYTLLAGSAGFNYRLTRYVPLYVQYSYYHSRFERALGLEPGFPLLSDHHGVQAGLSYSVPVIGRRVP